MNKLILLLSLAPILGLAQNRAASVSIGQQAAEVSISTTNDRGLIFGGAFSAVNSNLAESRATKNDQGKAHDFKTKYTPAAFGLLGGDFENLCMIGKLGVAYVHQTIDGANDPKKIYFVVGVAIDVRMSKTLYLRNGYDSVNGFLTGINIKL
jgi:hypothetical protein